MKLEPHAMPTESASTRHLHALADFLIAALRMYAGCFFSSSLYVGAALFAATAIVPRAGVISVLALLSASLTARVLRLVSYDTPLGVYVYSALFLGLGASATFASLPVAVSFALLGAAASVVLTAGLRGFLQRFGLPTLALPFMLVYLCAISAGRLLGADWAVPEPHASEYGALLPAALEQFLTALGAILFAPRIEVGLLVLLALCLSGRHTLPLALMALAVVWLADRALGLPPAVRFASIFNAAFSAVGLGTYWYAPGFRSYGVAAAGALLCVLLTLTLAGPLGRLDFVPFSLPFNLSIYAVLLVARQRSTAPTRQATASWPAATTGSAGN